MFKKHKNVDHIDLGSNLLFDFNSNFKQMKPLVREFFRNMQGLTKRDGEGRIPHPPSSVDYEEMLGESQYCVL